MFELLVEPVAVEVEPSGAFDAAARSGVDVYRALEPAAVAAGIRELESLLAREATFRRVSPDWPAPGSPWAGLRPGPELAAAAAAGWPSRG